MIHILHKEGSGTEPGTVHKAKETVGEVTGDEELEAQGQGDQVKSNLKQAGEKIKDTFKKDS